MKTLSGPDIKSLYSDSCAKMETYIMFRIAQRVLDLTESLKAKGRPPIRMSIGAPTAAPPAILMEKFREALQEPGIHTYSTPKGEPFFREAVAQRMKTRFGVDLNPKTEVCSLLGSKEGLAAMFRAIITPRPKRADQDIILTPDPGYASYGDAIRIAGGYSQPVALTPQNRYLPDFQQELDALKAEGLNPANVKALILNYPSNPIGALAPYSYYEDTIRFARERNILVIGDNAYADMAFAGEDKPHSILEVPGSRDIAIEFHSLSKPYAATGWRIGFAVGNQDAVSILETVKGTMDSGVWKVIQKVGAFALTSPDCDAYIEKMNAEYEDSQRFMVEGFKKLGWPMDELAVPRATFYLWLPIPPRYTSCERFAADMMETAGVVVVPGTAFGQYGEGYFRLSLVNPRQELEEVLSRMETDGFTY
ncbi:MAG: aminotransferase class I/II-fold pyridoxal phosphate-dependent enzyme [Vampirovibrionales bacterium]|nr:aminotransferase class I/II-fold pyridoxal phosphate-dependent enzyme [Vampirovibrionales bacterium]